MSGVCGSVCKGNVRERKPLCCPPRWHRSPPARGPRSPAFGLPCFWTAFWIECNSRWISGRRPTLAVVPTEAGDGHALLFANPELRSTPARRGGDPVVPGHEAVAAGEVPPPLRAAGA